MKFKLFVAVAASLLSSASLAATVQYAGGSGQRSLGVFNYDPLGQIFTATTDNALTSFGFQLQTLNAGDTNNALTFTLLSGSGTGGSVIATRNVTVSGIPATRTPTWFDFDLTGTTLVTGQTYTALLSGDSTRYGLVYGPDINLFSGAPLAGDAYAGGRLFATNLGPNAPCDAGLCDANFRFTATPGAAPAVPEPASWALLI
ncbi:MAG: hypothetical protein EOP59_16635, partial [Sphingomonadales bacterium]